MLKEAEIERAGNHVQRRGTVRRATAHSKRACSQRDEEVGGDWLRILSARKHVGRSERMRVNFGTRENFMHA
eukprot:4964443-Pleurochrysis_carterae.AAC.3